MAMSAADQKIFEGISATKEDICNAYNFPVHILSASSGTFNNVDSANKYLVTKTVYSRWISFRDFVNAKLLPMYKDGSQFYFDFDISTFPEVQDDQKKLVDSLNKMRISTNEFRSMLGWDKSDEPGAEKILVPTGLVTLESVTSEFGNNITDSVNTLEEAGANDYGQNNNQN
jgi:hypothetical protein